MMSLAEISLWAAVKRQYLFKLRAYANLFISMVAVQVIALLFTLAGMTGTSGMGMDNINIELKTFSGTGLFIFTVLWILVSAFILTLPSYRNIDFSFVGNRLSGNLSNIGFLGTAAAAGGATIAFGSILLRNIVYYTAAAEHIISANFYVGAGELFTGMAVAAAYLLLFGAAGYLAGALMQLHRSLYVIVPALLIGTFFYESANEQVRIFKALDFFFLEKSPVLFTLKIAISTFLLWIGAMLLSNRTQVR